MLLKSDGETPCKAEPALVFLIEFGEKSCDFITKDARSSCALPGEQRIAAREQVQLQLEHTLSRRSCQPSGCVQRETHRELWGHCAAQIQRRHVGSRPKRRILSGFAAVEEVASWRTPPPPAPAPPPPCYTRDVSEPLLV